MDDIRDYLNKKAFELGLDRAKELAEIQKYLDGLYPGQCRAKSLNDGKLVIQVSSSSLASELRFQEVKLKNKFPEVKKIILRA